MIVEVQGMGFWTRVRLPSTPLRAGAENAVFMRVVLASAFRLGVKMCFEVENIKCARGNIVHQ